MNEHLLTISLLMLSACSSKSIHTGSQTSDDLSKDFVAEFDYSHGHETVSADGKLKVISGIHEGGGTSPDYWSVFRFSDSKGDTTTIYRGLSPYRRVLHTITKNDGSVYYLVSNYGKSSSIQASEWLTGFQIVGDTIREVNPIDGETALDDENYYSDMSVDYCIPDWYFTTYGEGNDWMFTYDEKTNDLYVPLTEGDMLESPISDRYAVWHFNGDRFVDAGERPHRDLHPSLSEYKMLIRYFTTKDYIVRVDSLDNGDLRYASWKKPKTMSDIPDIILEGGMRRQYPCAPNEYKKDDDFYFTNGKYEYIAAWEETMKNEENGASSHVYLLVKSNERPILKQEKEE